MKQTKLKALFIARQAGTVNAFTGLIEGLQRKISLTDSIFICIGADLPIIDGINSKKISTFEEFLKLNIDPSFDFVLTGTSTQSLLDSEFWNWSKSQRIPCFAFHDQWVNTSERFSNAKVLPDAVLIVDQSAKDLVDNLKLSLPSHIIGSPLWDSLTTLAPLRAKYPKNNLAVFATEPATPLGPSFSYKNENGFDDLDSLSLAAQSLAAWAEKNNQRWSLEIKIHPIDSAERILTFIKKLPQYPHIDISIGSKNKEEIFIQSQFIFGMRSMFLVEASLLGVPVVSFQPNRITKSPATDRPGIETVENFDSALEAMEKALQNSARIPRNSSADSFLQFLESVL